jgi:hypothetical protein
MEPDAGGSLKVRLEPDIDRVGDTAKGPGRAISGHDAARTGMLFFDVKRLSGFCGHKIGN